MNRMLPIVAAVVVGALASMGQAPASAKARPAEHLANFSPSDCQLVAGQYDKMVATLTLSEDQRGKLKEACDAMDEELKDWEADANDWREEHSGPAWVLAHAKRNQTGVVPVPPEDVAEEFRIRGERQEIVDKAEAKINKILTPEQRAQWEGHKIFERFSMRLSWVQLTAEQEKSLRLLCADVGKKIAALKDPTDRKAVDAVYGGLWKRIFGEVLTDEQIIRTTGVGSERPVILTPVL